MSSVVRLATFHDLIAIQEVATCSWYHTYREIISANSIQQFIERAYSLSSLERRLQNTYLHVIEQNNQVVGFANFSKVDELGFVTLIAIYLLPENQGQGLGRKLIHFAIEKLHHVKGIYLEVSSENERAIRFYQSIGFKVQDKYTEPFFEDVLHTTKMIWNLSS